MAYVLPLKHERLLTNVKGSDPIRVAFIASNFASWKVDQVVDAMKISGRFETKVLLGRMSNRIGETIADHEHQKLSSHFKNKGFDVVVGNPPYLELQKMPKDLIKPIKDSKCSTFAATGDLYGIF